MVELSLTLTLLLFILAGLVDFGRIYFALISLNDAAQEGAVYGSFNPADISEIQNHVLTSSSDPIDLQNDPDISMPAPTIIGAPCAGLTGGEPNGIVVRVVYQFEFTMPLIGIIITSNSIPLTGEATSSILYPPCP